MKHILIASAMGAFSFLALFNNAVAQNRDVLAVNKSYKDLNSTKDQPKFESTTSSSTVAVHSKALKDVKKFYHADNVIWTSIPNGVAATFRIGEVDHLVFYSKKGRWEGSVKKYNQHLMPQYMRELVRQMYYDDIIVLCEELETPESLEEPTYIVTINGEKGFRKLRIYQGDMEVIRPKTF